MVPYTHETIQCCVDTGTVTVAVRPSIPRPGYMGSWSLSCSAIPTDHQYCTDKDFVKQINGFTVEDRGVLHVFIVEKVAG